MEKALKKAMHGGYIKSPYEHKVEINPQGDTFIISHLVPLSKTFTDTKGIKHSDWWNQSAYPFGKVLLDPTFWQCLGKAMGWDKMPPGDIWQGVDKWKYEWHSLIDHLADGGNVDDFFNNLIK